MADLIITAESKNTDTTITNEVKPTGGDFDDFPGRTFGEGGAFGQPGTFLTKDSKNNLSITNEAKS